jgi:hypothetical protein
MLDATGAVIPSASVTVPIGPKGIRRTFTTNKAEAFHAPRPDAARWL